MSKRNEIIDRMQENRSDYYGSKYSEHLFSEGKVTDPNSSKTNNEDKEFSAKHFWKDIDRENDYSKKLTLNDKKKMLQREKLVSSGKILGDLRPRYFIRNFNAFIETITPEEIETLILIKNNWFWEWKKASSIGVITMIPIFYKFRSVMTFRSMIISGIFFPLLMGFFIGGYLNSKKALVLMDKLGSEYQLSRIYKQTIFTKRKDISEEMKAEIYMKMNKENSEFKDKLISNKNI